MAPRVSPVTSVAVLRMAFNVEETKPPISPFRINVNPWDVSTASLATKEAPLIILLRSRYLAMINWMRNAQEIIR